MNFSRKLIISFIAVMLLVTAACSFNASTANVKEAFTAHDVNGTPEATTNFGPDEIFYCLVTVANAPDDTVTKAVWYAENVDGVEPNSVLQQSEFTGGGQMTFNLSNNQSWPSGAYKVEIYIDDELKETLDFSVANNNVNTDTVSESASETITVKRAYMARFIDDEPQPVDTYTQDEIFYCIIELTDAQPDTTVKAVWTAVNIAGNDPNMEIDSYEMTGESFMTFNLTGKDSWPTGDYRIEIYLNGVDQGYLDFKVQ